MRAAFDTQALATVPSCKIAGGHARDQRTGAPTILLQCSIRARQALGCAAWPSINLIAFGIEATGCRASPSAFGS